jgi:hypothetical protein
MTEVQQARFDRLFNAFDCDRDGFLTLENFLDHAHKLAAMRGTTGSPAAQALLADLEEWWRQLAGVADTNGDGRVSRDEFLRLGHGPHRHAGPGRRLRRRVAAPLLDRQALRHHRRRR